MQNRREGRTDPQGEAVSRGAVGCGVHGISKLCLAMGTEETLHCKGIRLDTCFDLRPGSTGGDWKAFAGTGRIRADRRRTTAVAQAIEENVPAPVRLGRQDVALHVEFLEGADEP